MADSMWWWLLSGTLVALELVTGTFYLLMLALGAAAGALAAHLGLSNAAQMAAAALVGGVGTGLWHLRRTRQTSTAPADPLAHLDIGQTVEVHEWAADGSARVHYRGTTWTARPLTPPGQGAVPTGLYRIADMRNNELLLEKA